MARIRNRITKADFYTDPELLGWPRDKREFYRRTWAMAEDSGCLEDSPFGWKLLMYPSPLDDDVTPDLLAAWRDELMEAGKLIAYHVNGSQKRYLFITNFHEHERPRNPQSPDLPLPAWVRYEPVTVPTAAGSTTTRHRYSVDTDAVQKLKQHATDHPQPVEKAVENRAAGRTAAVQRPQPSPVLPSPDQPSPVQPSPVLSRTDDGSTDAVQPSHGKKKKNEQLPDVPVTICGPVAKIIGPARVNELLDDGTDLNLQARRLIALIDRLADDAFAHLSDEQRADRRDEARVLAFRRLAKTHASEPIQNLPAYITAMLKNDWHLGDLVGDDFVEAQRRTPRSKTTTEPQSIGDVLKGTVA